MHEEHQKLKEELAERKILDKVGGLFDHEHEKNNKRYAFKPVEWIVYAMVASILLAFLAAIISKVIPGQ